MSGLYQEYLKSLGYPDRPVLFLDDGAFKKNCKWILENAGSKKIRVATKSIRSKSIFKKILELNSVFQGLMTYDLREALWLRQEGFQDILMGYPTMDKTSLKELALNPSGITLMVDLPEHLEILNKIATEAGTKFEICVDVDMSMDLPGLRFGVYRSKINSEIHMADFLKKLKTCHHLKLTGLMGYEAQIAGVMDKESILIRALKKISLRQLQDRRQKLVEMIHADGHILKFVNGGGTGSLSETRTENCVSEITVGSGFFAPVLFDHYHDFTLTPSLLFTLPIVRHPSEYIFTCLGGGYIASGSVELIKQPTPYLPKGMSLLKHEGAGEVQTPFEYKGILKLKVGDSVIMRHAKAGEICERFSDISVVSDGKISETIKTYRGEGKTFV
jgi:D-serine deaminase-like pyridoxal phosphate-dependent protein